VKPSFGELALIESRQRAASVVATEDGALWALDRCDSWCSAFCTKCGH
jgi:CRP-like cAMP-binding protein